MIQLILIIVVVVLSVYTVQFVHAQTEPSPEINGDTFIIAQL
jgi:hypothetical protein